MLWKAGGFEHEKYEVSISGSGTDFVLGDFLRVLWEKEDGRKLR